MERSTDIVIQGYGAVLRKKEGRFIVTSDDQTAEYAVGRIRQVLITGECSVTTGALRLAAGEGVDVVICDPHGFPACRLFPCHGKGVAEVRRKQVAAASRPEGYSLVAGIIRAKVFHMGSLLVALGKERKDSGLCGEGERLLSSVSSVSREGVLPRDAGLLRGTEGTASRTYFAALARVIPPPVYTGSRSRHPASDVFNACLNYGYGILYSEVEKACILAGLDPYAGFLHADRYGHLSLVYDLIEQFRQPVVDRVVITLVLQGKVSHSDFDGKGHISSEAKRSLVTALYSRLDDERRIGDRDTTLRAAILDNVRAFAKALKDGSPYQPFRWEWRA